MIALLLGWLAVSIVIVLGAGVAISYGKRWQ